MNPEIENHPFWGEFFRRGVTLHPELRGLTPTGNMRKIGPNIGNRVQIDVNWTASSVSCRPLSSVPANLHSLLIDRDSFENDV